MSETSDLFEDSNDSLLDPGYFENVVDRSTSSSDSNSASASRQAHYKYCLFRTLAHLATAAIDNVHNFPIEHGKENQTPRRGKNNNYEGKEARNRGEPNSIDSTGKKSKKKFS